SYEFVVEHMFTVTSERLGITAGETERPTITKTDDGLVVTLTGLSPVVVSWKAVSDTTSAETGDTNPVLPLAGTCAAALAVIAMLAVRRRKNA
ncbi:MAG: LPXTG cell wall anchor domain-containing protein, partial [Clostridiales bacterium]|nr:LPXTG cell wall anchor domain-containing protein [Clostridiales bacterium]